MSNIAGSSKLPLELTLWGGKLMSKGVNLLIGHVLFFLEEPIQAGLAKMSFVIQQ